jgi:hypothetical protein
MIRAAVLYFNSVNLLLRFGMQDLQMITNQSTAIIDQASCLSESLPSPDAVPTERVRLSSSSTAEEFWSEPQVRRGKHNQAR